ncbi:PTS N,N'-diacetylchitobiose transporter subunit IIA [Providencia stuartii]|uniref:PTS N,N'-diacetylchitobiose transporter subunit IIA n=1 Tax=Providencia stuartii TaxID=588 RepID=UPI0028C09344|nr:PTS N,N'-diacetylchitobiose transporter subunit IIA [Providencia stuartii]MDT7051956.1 PTS N,N'-diacetylchitobiose transporter subunit IIA [Providencia stuartii]
MIDIDSNGTLSTDSLEEVVMGLIINSGRARSLAYKALTYAKEGKFVEAMELMEDSKEALTEAHKVQTKMIETDMGEGKIKVSLILVHAQDHLMNTILARELITELIEVHKKIN